MILSLLVGLALGTEAEEEEPPVDDRISEHRLPFSVLVERTIGSTSKPVEYNWRDGQFQLAVTGGHLYELNNFNSMRLGGMLRVPSERLIYEVGVSYVWVWDTPSSELLAFTPYRQPGRPSRIDFDIAAVIPVAEGVITTMPRRLPALELVFNAYVGVRYGFYPFSTDGMRRREIASGLASPALTDKEIENLDDRRLDAMQVDPGRYNVMAGIGNDIYFSQGFFLSPRVMFAVPIFAPASGTELYVWADLSLDFGVAF
ncbi:MAG: hypothetical protein GY913_13020 [Proteobacteria bacterium]|nr:hypothetical protein [Pseudomonadota bacterium]MCP4917829.1 hypothetical protein [Pseudomonadota bacterium]